MPSETALRTDRETALHAESALKLRLWLRMLTCTQLIETAIRTRLRLEFDTTLPRFDVLAQLHAAAEDTLSMGELSARLMVTSGSVTGLVDTMESDGLVERTPHPVDRRSTLIRMTVTGRDLFARMAPAHAGWIEEIMADLATSDAAQLHALLGQLKTSAASAG
jgi:DNA-binding MarR family transcriptional regulator